MLALLRSALACLGIQRRPAYAPVLHFFFYIWVALPQSHSLNRTPQSSLPLQVFKKVNSIAVGSVKDAMHNISHDLGTAAVWKRPTWQPECAGQIELRVRCAQTGRLELCPPSMEGLHRVFRLCMLKVDLELHLIDCNDVRYVSIVIPDIRKDVHMALTGQVARAKFVNDLLENLELSSFDIHLEDVDPVVPVALHQRCKSVELRLLLVVVVVRLPDTELLEMGAAAHLFRQSLDLRSKLRAGHRFSAREWEENKGKVRTDRTE